MASDSEAVERKNGVLLLVVITSILWIGTCAFLFSISKPCAVSVDFFAARVTCLSANELGDFLAGAFAPLAFLWLIAAVFLQRDELAAQRQELRDSRAVAAQQVEEARRNVEFIGKQTSILTEQQSDMAQDGTERQIDDYLDLVADIFSRMADRDIIRYEYLPPGGSNWVSLDQRGGHTPNSYVKHCIAKLDNATRAIEIEKLATARVSHTRDLQDVMTAFAEIERILPRCRAVKQLQIHNLQLSRMKRAYNHFVDLRNRYSSDLVELPQPGESE